MEAVDLPVPFALPSFRIAAALQGQGIAYAPEPLRPCLVPAFESARQSALGRILLQRLRFLHNILLHSRSSTAMHP